LQLIRISPCEQAWLKTSSSDAVTGNTVRNAVTLCSQYRNRCPSPIFLNEAAARLGYRPVDNAADNHAPAFRPVTELKHEEGVTKTGGFFAINALPDPLVRS